MSRDRQSEEAPELTTLWNEARKGVEIRRAFELRYRFNHSRRQDAKVQLRLRRDQQHVRVDTAVNEPDSVPARERRNQALHAAAGYGKGNALILPDEKELLADTFLQDHCIETSIQRTDGSLGVRFRPLVARESGYGIRGTIWLDSATFLVRRIEYEHLDGNEPFSHVDIDYADVRVGGSALRLPSGGKATLRPRGPARLIASGVTAVLSDAYWGFEEIPPK